VHLHMVERNGRLYRLYPRFLSASDEEAKAVLQEARFAEALVLAGQSDGSTRLPSGPPTGSEGIDRHAVLNAHATTTFDRSNLGPLVSDSLPPLRKDFTRSQRSLQPPRLKANAGGRSAGMSLAEEDAGARSGDDGVGGPSSAAANYEGEGKDLQTVEYSNSYEHYPQGSFEGDDGEDGVLEPETTASTQAQSTPKVASTWCMSKHEAALALMGLVTSPEELEANDKTKTIKSSVASPSNAEEASYNPSQASDGGSAAPGNAKERPTRGGSQSQPVLKLQEPAAEPVVKQQRKVRLCLSHPPSLHLALQESKID